MELHHLILIASISFKLIAFPLQNFPASGFAAAAHIRGNDNDKLALLDINQMLEQAAEGHRPKSKRMNLYGNLSPSVGNLSFLQAPDLSENSLDGGSPGNLSGCSNLVIVSLDHNFLKQRIPWEVGTLLDQFEGEIPSTLGNLTQLLKLCLFNNTLKGSLPSTFSNLRRLQDARFCHNKLNGTIPPVFISLPSLSITLNLSHNSFTGPLPAEVGNLKFLTALDVSHNYLSSEIPTNLGLCFSLETLNMENSFFQGSIPDLNRLRGLQYLDLSRNILSGQDCLRMKVPYRSMVNNKLCGGIPQLHLQPCPEKDTGRPSKHVNLKLILPPVIVCSCLLFFSMLLLRRKSLLREANFPKSSFGRVYPKINFKELHDATERFSSKDLIGAGSFGTVYVGTLGQGEVPIEARF
ncbi:LRR receptor-like serine/threonine-protein kinase EFR [Sesamum alatum]|uniref:LRR receptor-like serine/threonine-protein kinase EFR n=1 Tax=Sesamum alatum TaxID=300844 RepID=A0AAE2CBV4_9LAMI|nr:LRR receptor-like serine/threonine-protein kinase EFR [Sesamum alatum]